MIGGYAGKIAFVDLTKGEIKTEILDQELARQYSSVGDLVFNSSSFISLMERLHYGNDLLGRARGEGVPDGVMGKGDGRHPI